VEQHRYSRNADVLSGDVGGTICLLEIVSGQYYSLNRTATRLWTLLEQPRTVDELAALLVDEFRVEAGACRLQVEAFLADMQQSRLIS
jgi:hypothetical protein